MRPSVALCLSNVMFKGIEFILFQEILDSSHWILEARTSSNQYPVFVRMEGLEPPRLSAPDPKSGTATYYATCAKKALFVQRKRKFRDYSLLLKTSFKIGYDSKRTLR